jgi:hypothetical protein
MLRDRDLSAGEAALYGVLLILGGAGMGALVLAEFMLGPGIEGDTGFVFGLVALAGSVWVTAKGCALLFSEDRRRHLLSAPTLYAVSVTLLLLALFVGIVGHQVESSTVSLPLAILLSCFAVISFVGARRHR